MNLDELQTVQSKERRNDTLQHLRDSFYDDVGEYVAELKNRRDLAADRADDPFGSPEVSRLTDEIKTATEVVEKVYERRMGKLVKGASLAAAGMSADTEGMTVQERDLFDDIVDSIQSNKSSVLETLAGESADPSPSDDAAPEETAEVSAASMMGEAGVEDAADAAPSTAPAGEDGHSSESEDDRPATEAHAVLGDGPDELTDGGSTVAEPSSSGGDSPDADRVTVRITDDVGPIYGVDDREYDLERADVIQLPEQNAAPLIQQDAAEKLD